MEKIIKINKNLLSYSKPEFRNYMIMILNIGGMQFFSTLKKKGPCIKFNGK